MTNKEAINMLSMIKVDKTGEFEPLHTWYGGIDKDMQEAVELAKKALSQPDIEAIRQEIEAYGSLMVEYSLNPLLSAEIRDMKVSETEKYIDKCVSDIVDDVLKQAKSEVLRIIDKQRNCHTCQHYLSGEYDGSCGSYICKDYSNWEDKEQEK